MSARHRQIDHGEPSNRGFFAIVQPCRPGDALDCSSIADGIGLVYDLVNPANGKHLRARLFHRRTCYTDSPLFESFARVIYGLSTEEIISKLRRRFPDMPEGIVEIWVFKKE